MEIDAKAEVCPICSYEFPQTPAAWRWIAIILLIAVLLWLVF